MRHCSTLPKVLDVPSLESVQGQVGWGFEQPSLVEGVPTIAGHMELDDLYVFSN